MSVQLPVRVGARPSARARVSGGLRWIVAGIVVAHGLIHLLGAAKGLGRAQVSQLEAPVSAALGVAWLVVGVVVVLAGALLAMAHRRFVLVGAVAALGSQAMIATAWTDASAGTVANAILVVAVVLTGFARRA